MRIIVGTKNAAKLRLMRYALKNTELEVYGLPDDKSFSEILETGKTVLDNARLKALAYAKIIKQPVISFDNALFFDGLAPEKQPGVNTRKINGRINRPNDQELITYYSQLISTLPKNTDGLIKGYWEYGICAALPNGTTKEKTFQSRRLFSSQPSNKIISGFPLESLQIDERTGKYCSEMTEDEQLDFYESIGLTGANLRAFINSLPNIFFI